MFCLIFLPAHVSYVTPSRRETLQADMLGDIKEMGVLAHEQ